MLFGGAAEQFEQRIRERHPSIDLVVVSEREVMNVDRSDVDCIVGWRFPPGMFDAMPKLKWIQSISVGVEDWVLDATLSSEVLITNTKGLYASEVAEYVIWASITLSRRLDKAINNQGKRRWRQVSGHSLAGKTIGIVGMGHVGRAIARVATSFGMRTIGISRDDSVAHDWVDEAIPVGDMGSVLDRLDFVVICVPLTNDTRELFVADVFAAIKEGAIVINVAREGIVDYASLLDALKCGHLGGAALDVFSKEPLPKRSPLWKRQNVLVTPHVSGLTEEYGDKVLDLICENLARFRSGRTLECVVDRAKGY